MHTREIAAYGGLVVRMPVFALVFMLFTMGNVGLPGTSGFVGEFLTLAGVFQVSTWVAFFAATGVILSACYALWLYRRVVFGDLIKESLKTIQDMDRREKLIFAPLVVGDDRCSASIRRWCSTSSGRRWRRWSTIPRRRSRRRPPTLAAN